MYNYVLRMINELVRYEAELKAAMQQTDNAFLEG